MQKSANQSVNYCGFLAHRLLLLSAHFQETSKTHLSYSFLNLETIFSDPKTNVASLEEEKVSYENCSNISNIPLIGLYHSNPLKHATFSQGDSCY